MWEIVPNIRKIVEGKTGKKCSSYKGNEKVVIIAKIVQKMKLAILLTLF
jgi:hypothetical protein